MSLRADRAGEPEAGFKTSIAAGRSNGSNPTLSYAHQLNFDVLSYIFLVAWKNQYSSQFIMASVCHHWREVALSTTRLWSTIPLLTSKDADYMPTMLSRAQYFPLHVQFGKYMTASDRQALSAAADRILCLKAFSDDPVLAELFPILERADLSGSKTWVNITPSERSLLDIYRFPKLYDINITSAHTSCLAAIAAQAGFPRLQGLSITCDGHPYFHSIISTNTCSNTLISLTITVKYSRGPAAGEVRLALPRLQHLRVIEVEYSEEVDFFFDTPVLMSFDRGFETSYGRHKVTFADTQSVTDIHTANFRFPPSDFPGIRNLWISCGNSFRLYGGQLQSLLEKALKGWTDLESIRYCRCGYHRSPEGVASALLEEETIRMLIVGAMEAAKRPFKVNVEKFDAAELFLPGSMSQRAGCNGMPCKPAS